MELLCCLIIIITTTIVSYIVIAKNKYLLHKVALDLLTNVNTRTRPSLRGVDKYRDYRKRNPIESGTGRKLPAS